MWLNLYFMASRLYSHQLTVKDSSDQRIWFPHAFPSVDLALMQPVVSIVTIKLIPPPPLSTVVQLAFVWDVTQDTIQ